MNLTPFFLQHANAYLNDMADYEQRVILQPYYDRPYSAATWMATDDLGPPVFSTTTQTLGQAINGVPHPYFWNPTTVSVLGTDVSFSGSDLANPEDCRTG